jgi:hypothetical protein
MILAEPSESSVKLAGRIGYLIGGPFKSFDGLERDGGYRIAAVLKQT